MLICDRGMSNLEYHARNYTFIMTIKLTNVLSVAGMINLVSEIKANAQNK